MTPDVLHRLVTPADPVQRFYGVVVGIVTNNQDPDGLHATVTGVTQQGRDKAIVRVSIGFTGYKARPTTYTLVQTKAGWRIADVSSADEASFLQGIEKSNREMRGKH